MAELTTEQRKAWEKHVEYSRNWLQYVHTDIGRQRMALTEAAILAVDARLLLLERVAEVSVKLRDNFEAWQDSAGTPDEAGYVLENGRLYGEWLAALAALDKPA